MSIAAAERAYKTAKIVDYHEALVEDNRLKAFAKTLWHFERQLSEHKDDDYWQITLRRLKGYRFRLISTPLAFDDVPSKEALQDVIDKLENCSRIYPQHADAAHDVAKCVRELLERTDSPLLEALLLQTHETDSKRAALLLKESRFVEDVEQQCARNVALHDLSVVTPSQLRTEQFFDRLFIFGPLRWFRAHEYVMTAPRAKLLHVIRYGFVEDGWKPETSFSQADNDRIPFVKARAKLKAKQAEDNDLQIDTDDFLSADEVLLPTIHWQHLVKRIKRNPANGDDDEFVKAHLCILENDHAIFLEADDKALVIDTRAKQVRQVKVPELAAGLFLVIREKGSGDYIVPFANKVLGEQAETLRAKQRAWKKALRDSVVQQGIEHVKDQLKRWGAVSASKQNIRNWMSRSERKIRPRKKEDFRAIMIHVDLDDYVDDYWNAAKRIGQAHLQAGRYMTRQLEQQLQNINWQTLEQRGEQTFFLEEYDEEDNAHLQTLRITSVDPEPHKIPLSRVGEILSEDDL